MGKLIGIEGGRRKVGAELEPTTTVAGPDPSPAINEALTKGGYRASATVMVDCDGDPCIAIHELTDDLTARDVVCMIGALEIVRQDLLARIGPIPKGEEE